MGKERLWDQGSLCPRGLGTQNGWVWQCCPQPGDTGNRLSSPPSLISRFIGATGLSYRALNPLAHPTGEEMGIQQVTRNFCVMSTWTPVGFNLPLQLQPPGPSWSSCTDTTTSQQHLRCPTRAPARTCDSHTGG